MASAACRSAVAIAAVGAALGCSSAEPPSSAPPPARSHARVELAVDIRRAPAGRLDSRVVAQARFLRYREVDAGTAELLAGGARPAPEPGRCEVADPERRLSEALEVVPERAVVAHLDAGQLLVNVDGVSAGSLSPRLSPPLQPYVGGVEYDELSLATDPAPAVPPGVDVSVTGFGGQHVAPFDVVATMPPAPEAVSVELGEHLDIRWDPGPAGDAALTVSVARPGEDAGVTCRTEDDGHLRVYRRVLDRIPGQGGVTVTLERSRRAPLQAAGVDRGELEVAVRYVVTAPQARGAAYP